MREARFSTYSFVREEIRRPHHGPRHTDRPVSAVYKGRSKGKGKKGKGKNKEKDKDPAANPDAEMICYHCHWKGHRKRDSRTFEKDKDK